jgi:methylthioribose-1-phosphate isomerase
MLRVRGAPAIGLAAALGMAMAGLQSSRTDSTGFIIEMENTSRQLASTRPTAVNLFWALNRMERIWRSERLGVEEKKQSLVNEACSMIEEDRRICRSIGKHGAMLLPDPCTVLTHCNAGYLATADYGTALAPVYVAHEQGRTVSVYADETRPLLQGGRLTTWELHDAGVPVTLICDDMAATTLASGVIDLIITGADRIAANGDAANKIGTMGLAILADYFSIPFYIAAPISTIDFGLENGSQIPIEERDAVEVTHIRGNRIAPEGIGVFNPAFDVTPASLITAIITEKGVHKPPFDVSLRESL